MKGLLEPKIIYKCWKTASSSVKHRSKFVGFSNTLKSKQEVNRIKENKKTDSIITYYPVTLKKTKKKNKPQSPFYISIQAD